MKQQRVCAAHGLRAAVALREEVARGTIGPVHAIELVFHNVYGPDKPWFQDPALSGGGCVIDLGSHLVDRTDGR